LVSAAAAAIVALMLALVRGAVQRTSALLRIAGAVLLAAGGAGIGELAEAFRFYGNLAALFLLTPLLSLPVQQGGFDRAMKAVLGRVGKNSVGYAAISTVLTFFTGIFLNLGSLGFIHALTGRGEGKRARVQCLSLARGFAAAMLVSPYSIAVPMIVSNFDIGWLEFFSVTAIMVVIFVGLHLAECYRMARGNGGDAETAAPPPEEELPDGRTAGKRLAVLALALVLLIGMLLVAETVTHYPMVTLVCVLSLAVPVIGFAAMGRMNRLWPAFREHYWASRLPEIGKGDFAHPVRRFLRIRDPAVGGVGTPRGVGGGRRRPRRPGGPDPDSSVHAGVRRGRFSSDRHHFRHDFPALIGFLRPSAHGGAGGAHRFVVADHRLFSLFLDHAHDSGLFRKSPVEIALGWNWRYTALTLAAVVLFEYLFFFL